MAIQNAQRDTKPVVYNAAWLMSLRAQRSNPGVATSKIAAVAPGLLRRCAPRNDGGSRRDAHDECDQAGGLQ
jgi:hypothetical protein